MEGPRKKLIDAARYWAGIDRHAPPALQVNDSIVEAMRAWGAPAHEIARVQAIAAAAAPRADAQPFGIWRDNAAPLQLFLDVRTQWVYVGMEGRRMGLNYAGVQAHLDIRIPRRKHRALMTDLQVMELAVLQADTEIRKQKEDSS